MLTTIAAGRVYTFSHVVGRQSTSGVGFHLPTALAIGQAGVVYVVSRGSENSFTTRVSKITIGAPGEEEFLGEFGKYGEGDGQLMWPTSVALDRDENVYVADEWSQCISIFDRDGNFLDKWDIPGAIHGEPIRPSGVIFDQGDNLYVVDSVNDCIQKFTKDGTFLGKLDEWGSGKGQFNFPWGLTIDNQGDIYVADWKNHRVQRLSPNGVSLATFGTFGTGVAELNHPTSVAVDKEGDVYVCDWANHRVQIFGPDGDFITSLVGDAHQISKWGRPVLESNPDMIKARRKVKSREPEWRFLYPTAVAFDEAESRLIVADCQRSRLQIYTKDKDYVDPQFNL